mgnify:CR=1 FL=1
MITRTGFASAFLGLAGLTLAACSPAPTATPLARGDWQLAAGESHLNFVSVKSGTIAEAHSFSGLSGSVTPDGNAELVIDLATVRTGIDIRDERMREHLFETETYPDARVTLPVDVAALEADGVLQPGDRVAINAEATLDLHGMSVPLETHLTVTRLSDDRVLVETSVPVLLHVEDFGLGGGLETLREIAGLPGIAPVTPVTVSLVFERG